MKQQEFDEALKELETRMERLRALYEQYFLGIERIEPSVARKDVDRRVYALRGVQLRNTAKRFRLQTLIQRYNTLQQHWGKICRQIENGTYTRHLARAERRFGADAIKRNRRGVEPAGEAADQAPTAQEAAEQTASDVAADLARELDTAPLGADDAPSKGSAVPQAASPPAPGPPARRPPPPLPRHAAAEGAPPARPRAKPPAPKRAADPPKESARPAPAAPRPAAQAKRPEGRLMAGSPPTANAERRAKTPPTHGTLSDDRVRSLYGELMETKRKLNQSSKLSEAALAKSLRESEAKLRQKHTGKQVDFKISVRDGKAIIKPILK